MRLNRLFIVFAMITLSSSMVISGCGQKGPLYLPEGAAPNKEQKQPTAKKQTKQQSLS